MKKKEDIEKPAQRRLLKTEAMSAYRNITTRCNEKRMNGEEEEEDDENIEEEGCNQTCNCLKKWKNCVKIEVEEILTAQKEPNVNI